MMGGTTNINTITAIINPIVISGDTVPPPETSMAMTTGVIAAINWSNTGPK